MRISATRLTSMAQAGGGRTPTQRAIAVLRRFGPDAHVYLPGVGMLNGLQAGNYIDSSGTTAATVDQPVGLVLDAAGGLGVELVTDPSFDTPASWATQAGWVVSGGSLTATSAAQFSNTQQSKVLVQGKTYVVSLTCTSTTGGIYYIVRPDATNGPSWTGAGTNQFIYTHSAGTSNLYIATQTAGFSATFSEISIREVTGIHAQQPTTSNKCILRQTGGRYNWVFDATDLLTATFPAGNESVTVIDALGTGQVTTTGVNVVGAYSMGPSVTLYGRMIVKGVLTASELALLQRFANRLAGL